MSQRHPIQNDITALITTVTEKRSPIFLNAAYAREAIETLYRVQERHAFFLYGFVIMPDHCHFLMHVPAPGRFSGIMNIYKSGVTFNLGVPTLWQPRFYMQTINNRSQALSYIHLNPVRKNLSETPEDYPWSSASGKWDLSLLDTP